ncbi:PREDICTED: transcription factor MYC1-like [Tarenaya hassleriana]|uniref:transcription factor MYC1-like n=1 Tax=Tarenaya hassleriana TaxID=28532 RepID=UPI00053C65BA|nr:PREDICTED: transcription factor MYC1-like [Tarenaya hassleriana]
MGDYEEGNDEVERHRRLRKQLAVAVRSVQWSYAIFWCSSPTQHGVLEWGEGYYNGGMKKRKKSYDEEMDDEFKARCKYGLLRSKQLRQLYLCMLEGDTTPTADYGTILSPEDLTDEEWYYLLCMSYAFSLGQGLPGISLATGETIWLCNAQYAESKLFTRSLLARSASIQTVVCFPFSGGVIELGATDLTAEDHNLLQHVKACFLDTSKPHCFPEDFSAGQNTNSDDDHNRTGFWISQENFHQLGDHSERDRQVTLDLGSEEDMHYRRTVSTLLRYAACRRNKPQHRPLNLPSSDSSSSFLRWKRRGTSNVKRQRQPQHPQNGLRKILYNVPLMHYNDDTQRTFERETFVQNEEIPIEYGDSSDRRRENEKFRLLGSSNVNRQRQPQHPQNVLRKILYNVPLMHYNDDTQRTFERETFVQNEEIPIEYGDSSDRRRENEKFRLLGSMVPTVDEVDKESILNNTIKYLWELEARVEELESCMGSVDFVERQRKTSIDPSALIEGTSDNYESTNLVVNYSTPGTAREHSEVRVKVKETEVVIEIRCPYREYIVADIMEAISNLHMDAFSVRSHTLDGSLVLNLKAKFREAAVASVGMIKRELKRVAGEF